jgi:Zn-dependent peptidase ImmA (M78 family)
MKTQFENLRMVREQLAGMSFEFVARRAGLSTERLAALEAGSAPATMGELERLAALYGIDAEQLENEPIELAPGDGVACLASAPEFRELGDTVRAGIIAAANAARDLVRLESILGRDGRRWEQLQTSIPRPGRRRDSVRVPFQEGARHARRLREHLGLGVEPIPSLLRLVRERFSAIMVLHARLGTEGPAGLAFVDRLRGPTIVLNLEGKNENACVRRVSLAHEICHLIVDWNRQEPLAMISGYVLDSAFEVEQRANAFAIRLLCPEPVVARLTRAHATAALEPALDELSRFGLPYAAIRLYLRNQAGWELPPHPTARDLERLEYPLWAQREDEPELERFPLAEVPPERRTHVAHLAAEAFSRGLLTRAAFASYLGASPLVEVERVLDALGLDQPRQFVA